jgi:colicin import membrane protein
MDTSDSSVLFSLNELRSLELQRQREEEEFQRARIAAEERTREEEARRLREEEERRAHEAEEARRAAELERERRVFEEKRKQREEALQAEIERQARLEAARVEAETRAQLELRPRSLMPLIAAAGVIAAGGIAMFVVMSRHDARVAAEQAAMAAKIRAEERAADAVRQDDRRRVQATIEALEKRLAAARSVPEAPGTKDGGLRPPDDKKDDKKKARTHAQPAKPAKPGVPPMMLDPKSFLDPTAGIDE